MASFLIVQLIATFSLLFSNCFAGPLALQSRGNLPLYHMPFCAYHILIYLQPSLPMTTTILVVSNNLLLLPTALAIAMSPVVARN